MENTNYAKVLPLPKRVIKPRKKQNKYKRLFKRLYKKIDGYEVVTIVIGILIADVVYDLMKLALVALFL
jgi:hypothetical protein